MSKTKLKNHWENVYSSKDIGEVSWYQPHADLSLSIIIRLAKSKQDAIIDVGGGASVLSDDLLTLGYTNLTVLDISAAALEQAKLRLGDRQTQVNWLEGDITKVSLPSQYFQIWHDRAVFHFLTEAEDRKAYVELVSHSVKPGGHVIIATFGPDGPLQCSGLPIVRYDHESLHNEFGSKFILLDHQEEDHLTPAGKVQKFTYCYCLKQDNC